MAIERQSSISSYRPVAAKFLEGYEYLEGLDTGGPVVNHSKKDYTIAINLNDFVKCAAEHRLKVADISELRERLKDSRTRKLIDTNKATKSTVGAYQANHSNAVATKQPIGKCRFFRPDCQSLVVTQRFPAGPGHRGYAPDAQRSWKSRPGRGLRC